MPPAKTANRFFLRLFLLLLHAAANVAAIAWLTGFDLTGSWLLFLAFVLAVLVLLYAFLKHLFSFLSFLKQN